MSEGCVLELAKILNQLTALQEALGRKDSAGDERQSNSSSEVAPTPRKLIRSWLSARRSFNVLHTKVNIRCLDYNGHRHLDDPNTDLRELGIERWTNVGWKKMGT